VQSSLIDCRWQPFEKGQRLLYYLCSMLQLPITVRVPQVDEMPHREDAIELLAKRKTANITQGYTIKPNQTPQLHYAFYAEINIDNNRLWPLFLTLAVDMPAEVHCVYGLQEDEATTTEYLPKKDVLKYLAAVEKELTMDCTLEFGLLYHSKDALTEIAVTESKYIKFWGNDKAKFLRHMHDFQLKEIANLAFIDEYPKIVMPLRNFMPNARRPEDVVWFLNRAFGMDG